MPQTRQIFAVLELISRYDPGLRSRTPHGPGVPHVAFPLLVVALLKIWNPGFTRVRHQHHAQRDFYQLSVHYCGDKGGTGHEDIYASATGVVVVITAFWLELYAFIRVVERHGCDCELWMAIVSNSSTRESTRTHMYRICHIRIT